MKYTLLYGQLIEQGDGYKIRGEDTENGKGFKIIPDESVYNFDSSFPLYAPSVTVGHDVGFYYSVRDLIQTSLVILHNAKVKVDEDSINFVIHKILDILNGMDLEQITYEDESLVYYFNNEVDLSQFSYTEDDI